MVSVREGMDLIKVKTGARQRMDSTLQYHPFGEVKNQPCTSDMKYYKELRKFLGTLCNFTQEEER